MKLLLAIILLFTTASAQAADTKNLTLGIGSGVDVFTGNLGKLYGTSSAVKDARLSYLFCNEFSLAFSFDSAKFNNINEAPSGIINTRLNKLSLMPQYHFLGASEQTGFDPYITAALTKTYRHTDFTTFNTISTDNAWGYNFGVGTSYYLLPHTLALWAEAKYGTTYFQDRQSSTFAADGIPDQTGSIFSAYAGISYSF